MKTKLPPMPLGDDSMLFSVKLTDEQLGSVVSALSLFLLINYFMVNNVLGIIQINQKTRYRLLSGMR
jgi:hypothetical protein